MPGCRPVSIMTSPAPGCSSAKEGIGTSVQRERRLSRPRPRRVGRGPLGRCRKCGKARIVPVRSGCTRTVAPGCPPGNGSRAGRGSAASGTARQASLPSRMESSGTAPLAPGLLDGVVVATAGGARAVAEVCARLGAATPSLDADLLDEPAVTGAAQALGHADVLVCDAAGTFVAAGGGLPALRAALDGTWNAIRAVTNAALR